MGFLSGGDMELRISRRAVALALAAAASLAAFALGMRWAVEPTGAPIPAPPMQAPAIPAPAPAPTSGSTPSGVAASSPVQPGLEVMVGRLEAKVRGGSATPDQWLLLGQTYRELGRDAEAVAAFERALTLEPANAAARAELDAARAQTAGRPRP